ncbi:hypothetical protein GW17_00007864 [Ensete ventricosum]|nr:hypothetical protein GW17_00007864 [Ensete ventricosum]
MKRHNPTLVSTRVHVLDLCPRKAPCFRSIFSSSTSTPFMRLGYFTNATSCGPGGCITASAPAKGYAACRGYRLWARRLMAGRLLAEAAPTRAALIEASRVGTTPACRGCRSRVVAAACWQGQPPLA